MLRTIIMSGLLLTSIVPASAGIDLQIDRAVPRSAADRAAPTQAGLMQRWIAVGRCVVGRDRMTSLAFTQTQSIAAPDDKREAARRLDPIFATCLAGSGAPGPSSVVLRRAALADALGIALPRA